MKRTWALVLALASTGASAQEGTTPEAPTSSPAPAKHPISVVPGNPSAAPAEAPVAQVAPLTAGQTACITLTRKAASKVCTALDRSSNAAPVMKAAVDQEKQQPSRIAAEYLPQAEAAAQALIQGDAVLHTHWCGLMSADAEAVARCSANPVAWSTVIESDVGALRELKMQLNSLAALSASTVYQSQYKQVESTLASLKSELENLARTPTPPSALPGNPLATGR